MLRLIRKTPGLTSSIIDAASGSSVIKDGLAQQSAILSYLCKVATIQSNPITYWIKDNLCTSIANDCITYAQDTARIQRVLRKTPSIVADIVSAAAVQANGPLAAVFQSNCGELIRLGIITAPTPPLPPINPPASATPLPPASACWWEPIVNPNQNGGIQIYASTGATEFDLRYLNVQSQPAYLVVHELSVQNASVVYLISVTGTPLAASPISAWISAFNGSVITESNPGDLDFIQMSSNYTVLYSSGGASNSGAVYFLGQNATQSIKTDPTEAARLSGGFSIVGDAPGNRLVLKNAKDVIILHSQFVNASTGAMYLVLDQTQVGVSDTASVAALNSGGLIITGSAPGDKLEPKTGIQVLLSDYLVLESQGANSSAGSISFINLTNFASLPFKQRQNINSLRTLMTGSFDVTGYSLKNGNATLSTELSFKAVVTIQSSECLVFRSPVVFNFTGGVYFACNISAIGASVDVADAIQGNGFVVLGDNSGDQLDFIQSIDMDSQSYVILNSSVANSGRGSLYFLNLANLNVTMSGQNVSVFALTSGGAVISGDKQGDFLDFGDFVTPKQDPAAIVLGSRSAFNSSGAVYFIANLTALSGQISNATAAGIGSGGGAVLTGNSAGDKLSYVGIFGQTFIFNSEALSNAGQSYLINAAAVIGVRQTVNMSMAVTALTNGSTVTGQTAGDGLAISLLPNDVGCVIGSAAVSTCNGPVGASRVAFITICDGGNKDQGANGSYQPPVPGMIGSSTNQTSFPMGPQMNQTNQTSFPMSPQMNQVPFLMAPQGYVGPPMSPSPSDLPPPQSSPQQVSPLPANYTPLYNDLSPSVPGYLPQSPQLGSPGSTVLDLPSVVVVQLPAPLPFIAPSSGGGQLQLHDFQPPQLCNSSFTNNLLATSFNITINQSCPSTGRVFQEFPGDIMLGSVCDDIINMTVLDVNEINEYPDADRVFGQEGGDTISGLGLSDLFGCDGDDILIATWPGATLYGGPGADAFYCNSDPYGASTVSYLYSSSGVTLNILNPAENTGDAIGDMFPTNASVQCNLRGSDFDDNFTISSYCDNFGNFNGGEGSDILNVTQTYSLGFSWYKLYLYGDAGNDTLICNFRCVMNGGPGADTFIFTIVFREYSSPDGSAYSDMLTITYDSNATIDMTFPNNGTGDAFGDDFHLPVDTALTLVSSDGDDVIQGIFGFVAAFTINSRNGNDVIQSLEQLSWLYVGDNMATAYTGNKVIQDVDNCTYSVIRTGRGNDVVQNITGSGDVYVYTSEGNDTIQNMNWLSIVVINSGSGANIVQNIDQCSSVTVNTLDGADIIQNITNSAKLSIDSGDGNDVIQNIDQCGSEADTGLVYIQGACGNDTIYIPHRSLSDNVIYGEGQGYSSCSPGDTYDTFVITDRADCKTIIHDFELGKDLIDLSVVGVTREQLSYSSYHIGLLDKPCSYPYSNVVYSKLNISICAAEDVGLILCNIDSVNLTDNNFIFA